MKIKIIMFLILGISVTGVCLAQTNPNSTSTTMENNADMTVNADMNIGVTTSMSGNKSSFSGNGN